LIQAYYHSNPIAWPSFPEICVELRHIMCSLMVDSALWFLFVFGIELAHFYRIISRLMILKTWGLVMSIRGGKNYF
jgi:hypothetical protein